MLAIAILWASAMPVQNTEETLVHDATPTPATTKVGDIVAGDYRTAAVFEKHGIDFCCGGSVTLAAACTEKAIDPPPWPASSRQPRACRRGVTRTPRAGP